MPTSTLSKESKAVIAVEFRKAAKAMQEIWSCLGRIGQRLDHVADSELTNTIEDMVANDTDVDQLTDDQIIAAILDHMVGDAADEEKADAD